VALAEARGSIEEAIAKLSEDAFLSECDLVCRVMDIKQFIKLDDRIGDGNGLFFDNSIGCETDAFSMVSSLDNDNGSFIGYGSSFGEGSGGEEEESEIDLGGIDGDPMNNYTGTRTREGQTRYAGRVSEASEAVRTPEGATPRHTRIARFAIKRRVAQQCTACVEAKRAIFVLEANSVRHQLQVHGDASKPRRQQKPHRYLGGEPHARKLRLPHSHSETE